MSSDDVSPVRSSNNSTCLSPQADTNKRERPYKCQTCDQSFTQVVLKTQLDKLNLNRFQTSGDMKESTMAKSLILALFAKKNSAHLRILNSISWCILQR